MGGENCFELVVLSVECFEGEECAAEVTGRDHGEESGNVRWKRDVVFFSSFDQDIVNLSSKFSNRLSAHCWREIVNRKLGITCCSVGAPTRNKRHLDRIGPIIFAVEFAHKMTLKFAVNFSIVLLRADCASLDNPSASLMITTRENNSKSKWANPFERGGKRMV